MFPCNQLKCMHQLLCLSTTESEGEEAFGVQAMENRSLGYHPLHELLVCFFAHPFALPSIQSFTLSSLRPALKQYFAHRKQVRLEKCRVARLHL